MSVGVVLVFGVVSDSLLVVGWWLLLVRCLLVVLCGVLLVVD